MTGNLSRLANFIALILGLAITVSTAGMVGRAYMQLLAAGRDSTGSILPDALGCLLLASLSLMMVKVSLCALVQKKRQ